MIARDLSIGRLGRLVLALSLAFAASAAAMTPAALILLLNGLSLSVSAGVATAYLPVAGSALARERPSRADVLGAGIFLAGVSDVTVRVQSLLARDFGRPEIVNTDATALAILVSIAALVAFLWAPHAEEGRVPREKWRRAGLVVATGVAIALGAGAVQHRLAPAPLVRLQ